jgi:hypothetical protein
MPKFLRRIAPEIGPHLTTVAEGHRSVANGQFKAIRDIRYPVFARRVIIVHQELTSSEHASF